MPMSGWCLKDLKKMLCGKHSTNYLTQNTHSVNRVAVLVCFALPSRVQSGHKTE